MTVLMLPRKLTVPEVLPLADAYLAKPGNAAGGSLHVVLDDFNLHDTFVEECESWAEASGDEDGVHLARALRLMTRSQRGRIAKRAGRP